jgi:hypothetical protein
LYTAIKPPQLFHSHSPHYRKKLLFLTNRQAQKFNFDNVSKLLLAMEIQQPKLLINLFGSFGMEEDISGRAVAYHKRAALPHVDHSEVSDAAFEAMCSKLCTFLVECVIPLAAQTHALVVVHNEACTLAQCLDKVMPSVRSKYGRALPFTIVNFGWATIYHAASGEPGSVAAGLRASSDAWQGQLEKITEGLKSSVGQSCTWEIADAPSCATHYVIVDAVSTTTDKRRRNTTTLEFSALKAFKNEFIGALSESLPNIAVAALNPSGWSNIQVFAEYTAKGLPLLLIDTRSRGEEATAVALVESNLPGSNSASQAGSKSTRRRASDYEDRMVAEDKLTAAAVQSAITGIKGAVLANCRSITAELRGSGKVDRYVTSNLAYAHSVRAELANRLQGGKRQGLLDEAIAASEQPASERGSTVASGEQKPDPAACMRQFSDELATVMLQLAADEQELLIAREKARLASDMQQLRKWSAGHLQEFKKAIQRLSGAWVFQGQKNRCDYLLREHAQWFEEETINDAWNLQMGHPIEIVTVLKMKGSVQEQELGSILDKLDEAAAHWQSEDRHYDVNPLEYCAFPSRTGQISTRSNPQLEATLAIKMLLTSPSAFSGSLGNLDSLQATLERAAKIDRLPTSNSREALLVLRQAWDHVDTFNHVAKSNKTVAKAAFVALLATSLWVTCSSVVASNVGTLTEPDVANISHFMLVLTLLSSLIAGYMSYADPLTKWHELKAASLDLESEIWKFRCRVGGYSTESRHGSEQPGAESYLASSLRSTKQHVFKSASLQETGFYAKLNVFNTSRSSVYKHGQYPRPCTRGGTLGNSPVADNHQSPLRPQEYLDYRVKPLVRFYQKRLPAYYRSRSFSTAVLMLSTIASSLLILLQQAPWTSVLAALSTVLTAWAAFHSTDKKLARYSATINAIDELVLWWNEMTDVEKASIRNINVIVGACEKVFKQERQAWLSTSLSQRMIVQNAKEGPGPRETEQPPQPGQPDA